MFSESPVDMSSRYAPADEVRILTGGIDLFSVLYARAAEAYPRGIWVEAFGAVRGASIIELVGDRHRESVREATLSQMSCTVFHDGETPDIRSVATLTWREKRTPQSLTGFLASALAMHVTLRIREIEIDDGTPRAKPAEPARESAAKQPKAAAASTLSSDISKTKTIADPREGLRGASSAQEVDAAVARLAELNKKKRGAVKDAVIASWDDLGAQDSSAPAVDPNLGWGDLLAAQNEPAQAPAPAKASPDVAKAAPEQPMLDASWGSWDEVAKVSAEVALRPKTAASTLKRGEVLVHPTLGNCTILSVVSESVVMVKPKHDTSRKISLKPFEIFASGKAGIYELERRA